MRKVKIIPKQSQHNNKQSVQQLNARLKKIGQQYRLLIAQKQYAAAIDLLKKALLFAPNHPKIITDLAYCYLQAKQFELAKKHYLHALQLHKKRGTEDTNLYDGLTEVYHYLNDNEGVKQTGQLAIQSKLRLAPEQPIIPQLQTPPPPFKSDSTINIISFSLFGANAKYCETAIMNVFEAKDLFPEWTCRFYCDESVPKVVRDRLQQAGAQVILVSDEIREKMNGLFWRFLVIDDVNVERFLIRDADSIVSTREKYAVNEWLQSDKWFHIMRDYHSHTELILAGMWGGTRGAIHNIETLITDYIQSGNYLTKRVMDQHFLRYCIYPMIKQNMLHHDSLFETQGSQLFPEHPIRDNYEQYKHYHVGCNISVQIDISVEAANEQIVNWSVKDENEHTVCEYQAKVFDKKCSVDLPRPLVEKILAKKWKVITQTD